MFGNLDFVIQFDHGNLAKARYYDETTEEIFNRNLLDNIGKPSGLAQSFEYEKRKNGKILF